MPPVSPDTGFRIAKRRLQDKLLEQDEMLRNLEKRPRGWLWTIVQFPVVHTREVREECLAPILDGVESRLQRREHSVGSEFAVRHWPKNTRSRRGV